MFQSFINPILSVALLSFVVLFCCGQSRKSVTNNSNSTTPVTENAKGEITISAADLFNEYSSDRDAAEKKFKGKTLIVTGNYKELRSVSRSILLTSGSKSDVLGVQCILESNQQNRINSLRDGQMVTVKGVCTAKIGNVVLSDCSIQ